MLTSNERIRLKRLERRQQHLEQRIRFVNIGTMQERPDHNFILAEEVALRWAIRWIKEKSGMMQIAPDEEEVEWTTEKA